MTDQTPVEVVAKTLFMNVPLSVCRPREWTSRISASPTGDIWRENARQALASLAQHRDDIARAIAARWWDRDSGETDLWDDLTPDEQANGIEDIGAVDLADAVLAYLTGGAR